MSALLEILATTETSISDLRNPRLWLTEALSGTWTSSTGEQVSPNSAYGLSVYYAAMKAISEDVATLPLKTYRRMKPRGKETVPEHPAYAILHDAPNPNMTAVTFREAITAHTLGWGNGYAAIERSGANRLSALWLIHPSRVEVYQREDGSLYYLIRRDKQEKEIVNGPDMLHLRNTSDDGLVGMSVAKLGAESLGVGLANQKFRAKFYANGVSAQVALKHPDEMDPTTIEKLRTQFAERVAGMENMWKPFLLDGGMELEKVPLSITPEDAQMLETTQFSIEDICRWFRISPIKVGHLLRATFSNVEQQAIDYVQDTLRPWLVRWEQELKRKIFPNESDIFAEHLVTALLRGDQASRAQYYTARFQMGSLSRNDIRELENENPVADGDRYYVPANLVPADKVDSVIDAQANRAAQGADPRKPGQPAAGKTEPASKPVPKSSVAVLEPIALDAMLRIVRKEQKAVERAAKRCSSSEKFAAWFTDFLDDQHGANQDVVQPVTEAVYGVLDGEVDPVAVADVARLFADWHRQNTRQRVDQAQDITAEAARWEDRAEAMAAKLMELCNAA